MSGAPAPALRLSVLDQPPVGAGFPPADSLRASVELAQAAEELGYVRYWTAEHHGSPGFAGCAPEILAAVVLGRTRRMRVGTGGVLLPRYSPAKWPRSSRCRRRSSPAGWTWARAAAAVPPTTIPSGCGRCGYCSAWTAPKPARRRRERAGPTRAAPDVAARRAMRWKTASNTSDITFDGRLSAARQ
ncbi:LLM class flavin-dependent oxidoreductase [Streptomyces panaciradicis]|uniref:LLM class flavin-dependent oxidoreductase n=1 Tax=Streptomyces panaciradicis TaxID=1470261 RepID=UPI00201D107E|nr:LLM class flavin-dependent oxidoreductase [Streptomyces panaciradicis]MCL6673574.1 LLM class flavin-dependent oxidoreductase [Streptomyces panaciradicis]